MILILTRDQEMRFTVHDSPDYFQLKVSIFNDDKKTELIGETRVSLEDIIVPGGGQNDLWHHLSCKGRFAGEVRIELTYYDTRPKEAKPEDRRQSGTMDALENQQREASSGLNGPRQPKPVKRRPLPADPTVSDPSRSSPQPYTPPPSNQYSPSPYQQSPAPPPDNRMASSTPTHSGQMPMDSQGRQSDLYGYGQPSPNDNVTASFTSEYGSPSRDPYDGHPDVDMYGNIESSRQEYNHLVHSLIQQPAPYSNGPAYHDEPAVLRGTEVDGQVYPAHYDDRGNDNAGYGSYGSSPPKISPLPQHVSMPDVRPGSGSPGSDRPYHQTLLPASHNYEQRFPRHQSLDGRNRVYASSPGPFEDDSPPPPPAHRSSPIQPSPQSGGRGHAESYPPIAGPPPLNIRNARNSMTASPLSQVHTNALHDEYQPSTSLSMARMAPQTSPLRSAHDPYSEPDRRRSPQHFSPSPTRDYGQPTPPSLVPGYDPRIAEDESERLMRESQSIVRQTSEPVPQYQAFATHNTLSRAHPTPRPNMPTQAPLANHTEERRPHRASAPVIPRREVSPDTRRPIRKSVSPQPEQAGAERRSSAVPFGPDSYDAFNPSLNDAASINSSGPKYNTPEQSREAKYERERENKLAEGPIIGSDGREIDPSDHLPTETWAPEPETKGPKKKPEVTVRFRRSPAGARTATDVPIRPNPMVTQAYAHSSDPISPTTGLRARLQKKSHIATTQPMSSPAVPTLNTNARPALPSPHHSDYPLREYDNYGYNNSPTYARQSPGSGPPPIPGKVPLSAGTGQEDWGMDALSEEMRRIDIGVGPGQGRSRRNRYRP